MWAELAAWPHVAVAFDSPQRLPATLRSLAEALPGRPAAVCRELTKRFEEIVRGTPEQLAARFAEPPKGEIALVIGPAAVAAAADGAAAEEAALAAVARLVEAGTPRKLAVEVVAGLTGSARRRLYDASL